MDNKNSRYYVLIEHREYDIAHTFLGVFSTLALAKEAESKQHLRYAPHYNKYDTTIYEVPLNTFLDDWPDENDFERATKDPNLLSWKVKESVTTEKDK